MRRPSTSRAIGDPLALVPRSGRAVLAGLIALVAAGLSAPEPVPAQGYGASAAVADGTVLVGAPMSERRPGTVYLYRRDADGGWAEIGQITAGDGVPGDRFGRSLAVHEGTLWAGATSADSDRGAVYVFGRTGPGEWKETTRIQPDELQPEDGFGRTVAVDGEFALVAAVGRDSARGAVYVYRRDGDSEEWTRQDRFQPEDGAARDLFGASVALEDEVALVGAPGHDGRTGAVYVFRRDATSGSWRQTAKLEGSTAGENTGFGAALLLEEGRAMIGSPGHDRSTGAIFSFEWNEEESSWKETARLLPFDGRPGTRFGSTLARVDGELWIGAPGADRTGGIYRYQPAEGAGQWTSANRLTPPGLERGDQFASAFAIAGEIGVAGLTGDDHGAGTALILQRDASGEWTAAEKVWSELENYSAVTGEAVACGADGQAAHFRCEGVDLLSFLPVEEIGGSRGVRMSDIWGWTDPESGREYALAGRVDGTAFVDVTDPTDPIYLGSLPLTEGAWPSSWRDIKVYGDHAYIVADNAGDHGIQIFDLTRLRDVSDPPVAFEEDAHYDRVNSVHNIVINPESGFAYAVGSGAGGETCGGGLHMIDVREPRNPEFAGCFADQRTGRRNTGYTHDAQCLIYRGPDQEHQGKEICVGANETAVSVADVSDKANPQPISVATYPNHGYVHQGWFGPDQRYFYLDDELDELQGKVARTRTLVWDMSQLDDPILAHEFAGPTACSDHNLYVIGDRVFQSNYQCGFRVLDISEPEAPVEIGWLDTVPYGENEPSFGGSWSNYPFFASGIVVVNSGNEGLFVLRPAGDVAASKEALETAGPVRSAKTASESEGSE